LPLKLGEFTYVYLLKKDRQSSIAQGLSSLMVIRIFDLLAISLLFILISLLTHLSGSLSIYFTSILGFMAFLMVVIIILLIIAKNDQAIFGFFFRFPVVQKIPWIHQLRQGLEGIFEDLKQYQWREYLEWTGLAAVEWFINYLTYHTILIGIGLAPTFYATAISVTFAALASVLPINSFGNFGTQEAGWATGLILLGYPQSIALSTGFATHLLSLAYMGIFGGIAWLSYLIQRKNAPSAV
jgi:glycosyltransferase 2 family protein